MPLVDLLVPNELVSSDWMLLPIELKSEAAAIRSVLRRARFMPRVLKLNPLDKQFHHDWRGQSENC